MRKGISVLVGAALFALCASYALAAIPDGSGVIHGCYQPQSDGHNTPLSVIDTAKTHGSCPNNQTELDWNQTGPQGPAGPPGPAGVSSTFIVEQDGTLAINGVPTTLTADCGTGNFVTGGGYQNTSQSGGVVIDFNGPKSVGGNPQQWSVTATDDEPVAFPFSVYAVCVTG